MNIYQKLAEARQIIRTTTTAKAGKNSYSGYDYFTPEQVEQLVFNACKQTKTICITNLKQDERGYYQELEFIDLEAPVGATSKPGAIIRFELRTEKPDIKATNSTQQMGGMDTYSERYIKMKVFQIKDNNLDFDAHDNRPVLTAPQSPSYRNPVPQPVSKVEPKHRDVGKDTAEFDAANWA